MLADSAYLYYADERRSENERFISPSAYADRINI